ncbi:ATP-dependent RNA helicase dbp10 [Smittium culicis]|uniref:RNA helicase n=1 Tax=Smittium culicis TaxID=133412 RepID=A0A1R1YRH2_9FUNG|nr:ATP-dependent RNA helicase dbp10 [Smittium culicis]
MGGNSSDSDNDNIDISSLLVPTAKSSQKKNKSSKEKSSEKTVEINPEETATKSKPGNKTKSNFELLGLSQNLAKATYHRGYRQPTPVQRKTIPVIVSKRDVVAMARTGSGKTASYMLPILHRLYAHKQQIGIRCVIIVPNRELAIQVYNEAIYFIKGSNSNLRVGLIVGGDSLESQFNLLVTQNPDIVIATPGRLLHVSVEMKLSFNLLEVLCFDEADRLFEMGFGVQLTELLNIFPKARQTLLFSATMPESLVGFINLGLSDPFFVRLDTELKLSENLSMSFFNIQENNRDASLMFLLDKIGAKKQTIIFCSTKYTVEYLHLLVTKFGYKAAYIYGSLDQTARQIQMNLFRKNLVSLLIVTDLAARGIDIPILDYVINYNFIDNTKIFVHRVGRVARAGRSGWAYSLLTPDELPYLIDLKLFLGRELVYGKGKDVDYRKTLVMGNLSNEMIHNQVSSISAYFSVDSALENCRTASNNSMIKYRKSRIVPSASSYKEAKLLVSSKATLEPNPLFSSTLNSSQLTMINSISGYKPNQTIFEQGLRGNKLISDPARLSIVQFRLKNSGYIKETKNKQRVNEKISEIQPEKSFVDDEYYIPHRKPDADTEKGYALLKGNTFAEQAQNAMVSLTNDDNFNRPINKKVLRWDSKKKNFVQGLGIGSDNKKLITTESGVKLPATYKTDAFKDYLKKTKLPNVQVGQVELPGMSDNFENKKRVKNFHTKISARKELDSKHINYEKSLKKRKFESGDNGKQKSDKIPKIINGKLNVGKSKDGKMLKSELLTAEKIRKNRSIQESKFRRSNNVKSKPRK